MGRVINPNTPGKKRNRFVRMVAIALRELIQQSEPNEQTRDLAAFIGMVLESIVETIDQSVLAWEKRGYWVKAERFRMDWYWAEKASKIMSQAVLEDDWATVAMTSADIAGKLAHVKVPVRHRLGTPWVGAWEKLQDRSTTVKKPS